MCLISEAGIATFLVIVTFFEIKSLFELLLQIFKNKEKKLVS